MDPDDSLTPEPGEGYTPAIPGHKRLEPLRAVRMPRYKAQAWIQAPKEQVYDAILTPEVWSEIMPRLADLDVQPTNAEGFRMDVEHTLAGVGIDRTIVTQECDPADRLVVDLAGALEGTYKLDLGEQGTGTKIDLDAKYDLTYPVLDRVLRRYSDRYNQQFDAMLENLKHHVEHQPDHDQPPETTSKPQA